MSTKKEINKTFIVKISFISLIILAIIVTISATYITTYHKNKVTIDEIFSEMDKEGLEKVSEKEFLKNFDSFNIKLTKELKPIFSGKELKENGKYEFKITNTLAKSEKIHGKNLNIRFALGANWINYTSSQESETIYLEEGVQRTTTTRITVNTLFPAKGPLLFTNVHAPKLYCYITWSANDPSGDVVNCYTYMTLTEKDYR